MMEPNTAAALYFHMGFSYKEILCSLAVNHWNVMSRIKKVANMEPINHNFFLDHLFLVTPPPPPQLRER